MADTLLRHFASQNELAETLAGELADTVKPVLDEGQRTPVVVLTGGSSPLLLMEKMAATDVDWSKVTLSMSDERCVPQDHDGSNAGQAERTFAKCGVEVKVVNLHSQRKQAESLPRPYDAMVLGMGGDGHICSMFPGEPMASADGRLTMEATASYAPFERITLTLDAVLDSKVIYLLIVNKDKADIIRSVLAGKNTDLPVARLMAAAGDKLQILITE